jgi:hypothetical protein
MGLIFPTYAFSKWGKWQKQRDKDKTEVIRNESENLQQ